MQIIEEPWRHIIADNLFDGAQLNKAVDQFLSIVPPNIENTNQRFQLKHKEILSNNLIEVVRLFKQFNPKDYLQYFPNRRKFVKEDIFLEIMYCGKYFSYPIHDENIIKSLSCVTYLWPENNSGTIIYDKDKKYYGEIEWKQNRTLIFAGETNKTWHSYESKNCPRVTLNAFIVRK